MGWGVWARKGLSGWRRGGRVRRVLGRTERRGRGRRREWLDCVVFVDGGRDNLRLRSFF